MPREMPRGWPGLLSKAALALVAMIAVVMLALGTFLWTDWGRATVCKAVAEAITSKIAGRIQVDAFDKLSLGRLRARGIRVFAPDGSLAIGAESADIEFDLLALLSGRYGWKRAEIKDGKVFVTEDAQGRINMAEVFRARSRDKAEAEHALQPSTKDEGQGVGKLDLRNMVSSNISLVIGGGSLPRLRLVNIYGIMRVHVLADGKVELRFDEYRGHFVQGLPTGTLLFHDVAGQVVPSQKHLLHFDGQGKTSGAPVIFALDIYTKPKKQIKIDAQFPDLTPAALPTLAVAAWSKGSPTLDVDVHFGGRNRSAR